MSKLGQNFLINDEAKKKIINGLNLESGDEIIEIGGGRGELTEKFPIYNLQLSITAIEKDKKLAEFLRQKFGGEKNIKIIEDDALKILPQLIQDSKFKIHDSRYKIVGNIPYYITGKLLRILSEEKNEPEIAILTIQKEVAQRIIAQPPKMNRLAAITQFWANPKIISFLPKECFSPAPDVESAIISLSRINADKARINADEYYEMVKILFSQPRKTILNNVVSRLKNYEKGEIAEKLGKIGIDSSNRPQNLSIREIINIAEMFNAKK